MGARTVDRGDALRVGWTRTLRSGTVPCAHGALGCVGGVPVRTRTVRPTGEFFFFFRTGHMINKHPIAY